MSEDIKLRKVEDKDANELPRGVIAMTLGDKVVFVKRVVGRMMPLPEEEQERLRSKHVVE